MTKQHPVRRDRAPTNVLHARSLLPTTLQQAAAQEPSPAFQLPQCEVNQLYGNQMLFLHQGSQVVANFVGDGDSGWFDATILEVTYNGVYVV
jgi:hypothetical protein